MWIYRGRIRSFSKWWGWHQTDWAVIEPYRAELLGKTKGLYRFWRNKFVSWMWLVIQRNQTADTSLTYNSILSWITNKLEYAKHGEAFQLKRSLDSSANPLHFLIEALEHSFPNIKFNYVTITEIEKYLMF